MFSIGGIMRSIQLDAVSLRQEFLLRGSNIIKKAIVELFILNPHVDGVSFNIEAIYSGHEYEERSRVWGFKAKLDTDLHNYVESALWGDRTLLRDSVGSLALILRELRPSAIQMFGSGLVTLNRVDWLPEAAVEQVPLGSNLTCPPSSINY